MRASLALLLATLACGEETLEVHLELRDHGCEPAALAEVTVVSIEIYGEANGGLCTLGRRCLFGVGPLADIDDLSAALDDTAQPLVDVDVDGAQYIHVVGRAESCWDLPDPIDGEIPDHPVCGSNDLAAIEGDVLPVEMTCAACTAMEVPLCP
ncbi:MAG: hypothetical protein K1X88_03550 [Nannocystaceae bacterium]|nr:hypothetical protein [Nannocystaceae bacterium]